MVAGWLVMVASTLTDWLAAHNITSDSSLSTVSTAPIIIILLYGDVSRDLRSQEYLRQL